MKHWVCQQGSAEWCRARMGKATASEFSRIIQPKKWEPTKGETRRGYAIYLLTELILDEPLAGVTTASLSHGHAWEENARAAYEMLIGKEVELCGFYTNDEMTYGASPDGRVTGEPRGVEIKCPMKPEIHVSYLMDNDLLVEEYFTQTQGELFVTQWESIDLISYHSAFPMVKVRVLPHPEFQPKLEMAVRSFCAEFSDLVHRAVDLGYLKETPPTTDWIQAGDVDMIRKDRQGRKQQAGDFDLTDEDVQRIWEKIAKVPA